MTDEALPDTPGFAGKMNPDCTVPLTKTLFMTKCNTEVIISVFQQKKKKMNATQHDISVFAVDHQKKKKKGSGSIFVAPPQDYWTTQLHVVV